MVRKTHVVGRGENIRDIAKKYGVSATDIKSWNKLRRGKVKEGDELIIEMYERQVADASAVPAPRQQSQKQQTSVPEPRKQEAAESRSVPERQSTDTARKRYSTSASSARHNERRQSETTSRSSKSSKKQTSKQKAKAQKPVNYTVKGGDNLEKIAKRNGTTVDALRKANGMGKNESMLREGQKIKLPGKTTSTSRKSAKSSSKKSTGKSKSTSSKKSSKRKR